MSIHISYKPHTNSFKNFFSLPYQYYKQYYKQYPPPLF